MQYELIIVIFAVWRLTHLFSKEDGPFKIFASIRNKIGQVMACFYCLSIWIALPFGLWMGETLLLKFIIWAALSGAACLLQQLTTRE